MKCITLLGVTIKFVDDWIIMDAATGARLVVGKGIIALTVGPEHFDRTRGLCGVLNGKIDDDLSDISGRQAVRVDIFADSWSLSQCENLPRALPRGECSTSAIAEESARRKCQMLFMNPFR